MNTSPLYPYPPRRTEIPLQSLEQITDNSFYRQGRPWSPEQQNQIRVWEQRSVSRGNKILWVYGLYVAGIAITISWHSTSMTPAELGVTIFTGCLASILGLLVAANS